MIGIGDLEARIDLLIQALEKERETTRTLKDRVSELELELSRRPRDVEALQEENRKLRRNTKIAAEKIEEIIEKI